MRELDGSAAGGAFVRTALALSAISGESVRIEDVRGDRPTPGLRPQHLAVVEALAAIRDAEVSGEEVGAETITFEPGGDGPIAGGEYGVDVDTAGSLTLLVDAILPLASALEGRLCLTATGGTDVAWSPPIDYLRAVKLPLLRRHGLSAAVEVDRRGFYPAGGGRIRLHLEPSTLEPIRLGPDAAPVDTGDLRLYSTEAAALAGADVARRQLEGALDRLALDGEPTERLVRTVASDSPGSAIVIRLAPGAGVSALGEPGKPAERVGREAADAALELLDGEAPVDRHAADQLLVFLALAGGRLQIPAVTDHVETGLDALEAFGHGLSLEPGPTVVADGGTVADGDDRAK